MLNICIPHKWGEWEEYKIGKRYDSWDIEVQIWTRRTCIKCKKQQNKLIKTYIEKDKEENG